MEICAYFSVFILITSNFYLYVEHLLVKYLIEGEKELGCFLLLQIIQIIIS